MECNKDEAVRAKELAERRVIEKNYASAKKYALKARNLYPELQGLSELLTTIDVYICAEGKTIGEADWFGILGLEPLSKYETITKQYRKLTFMLHPDKNNSPGAEGAFKLVQEAWVTLSDKTKRSEHERLILDHNNKLGELKQEVTTHSGGLSSQPGGDASHIVTKRETSKAKTQLGSTPLYNHNKKFEGFQRDVSTHRGGLSSQPGGNASTTFWTICNMCNTYYEYLRDYLNKFLMCPTCKKTFSAVEKAPPPIALKSSSSSSCQEKSTRCYGVGTKSLNSGRDYVAQKLGSGRSLTPNSMNKTTLQQGHFSTVTSFRNNVTSGCMAAPSGIQQANEILKREREERQSIPDRERSQQLMGNPSFKKKKIADKNLNVAKGDMANKIATGKNGADLGGVSDPSTGIVNTKRIYGFSSIDNTRNLRGELPFRETQSMLREKARSDIRKFLKEHDSATVSKNANKGHEKMKADKKQKSVVHAEAKETSDEDNDVSLSMSTNVPDPDFHNFDLDRTESCFRVGQVWSAYDVEGMPRYYARIQSVISRKPFKISISWLNSKSNSELGSLDWTGSGFAKTCGNYRPGKRVNYKTLNSFSKTVSWKKGAIGMICVFPAKMEVWALYRNWTPDWNQHTPDEVKNKYDMVEVLDDFSEEHGVSVIPLIKVAGFRTVFRKLMDPKEVRRIPKEEMFRFSHPVPSHMLTGEEAHNAPKGCWELDPAATPPELLEVITEANQAPMVENGGKTKGAVFHSSLKGEVDAGLEERIFQKPEDRPMAKGDGSYQVC